MAFLAGPWPARITWGAPAPAARSRARRRARRAQPRGGAHGLGPRVGHVGGRPRRGRAADHGEPHRAPHRDAGRARRGELGRDHRRRRGWPGRWRSAAPRSRVVAAFSPLTGDVFIDGSALRRRATLRAPGADRARLRADAARRRRRRRRHRSPDRSSSPPSSGSPVPSCWRSGSRSRWCRSGRCTGSRAGGSCSCRPGLVLHDPHALVEAVLFPRRTIRRLGPAEADADARAPGPHAGALGLALELELVEPAVISPAPRRSHGAGRVGDAAGLHPQPTRRPARAPPADRRDRRPVGRGLVAAGSPSVLGWRGWRPLVEPAAEPTAPTATGAALAARGPGGRCAGGHGGGRGRHRPGGPAAARAARSRRGRVDRRPPHRPRRVGRRVRLDRSSSGGPVPSVDADDVDAMAEAGVQTLYIQTAHTRSATPGVMEPERLAPIIQRAHDHRMHVVAWYLPTFEDVDADLQRAHRVGRPRRRRAGRRHRVDRDRRRRRAQPSPARPLGAPPGRGRTGQGDRRHHPVGRAPPGGEPRRTGRPSHGPSWPPPTTPSSR